ncbi:MAG: histidinol-phosphatase [Treponema sp.]|jgi:histidinol-phosphatase (PHP family)|nr:histidinol-phosphatase [Treponema sp.]
MKSPLFSSMHTHTIFCDGKDDVETMCRCAYEKKICSLGFSAHAPITKKTGIKSDWNLKDEDVDKYVEQVLAAKNRWRGKLEIFLGFEVDYIKGLRSAIDSDIKAVNPDYLIGSVHYVIPANGAEPFTIDGPLEEFEKGIKEGFGGDAQALMHYYYDALAEMTALGGFEILGHADLIKKNCQSKNYWPKEDEACRQAEIARAAAEAGLTAEVNTGGINRRKISDVYPSLSFLRLLRENNVPVIITSDAHCAADIDGNYQIALQTLIQSDYKEHLIFLGKDNHKIIWQKEKLS